MIAKWPMKTFEGRKILLGARIMSAHVFISSYTEIEREPRTSGEGLKKRASAHILKMWISCWVDHAPRVSLLLVIPTFVGLQAGLRK